MLFHVVWSALFRQLAEAGEDAVAATLQRNHFTKTDGKWDAPWRSCPDRVMPGTDIGTAPQESWRNSTLIPACAFAAKTPFRLAERLQASVVAKDLQKYQHMLQVGDSLQDWPSIGEFVDQHTFKNDPALAAEGRSSAQRLLDWNLHSRHRDSGANTWMLVPTSKLKVGWPRSSGRKKKFYKARNPIALPPKAAQHYQALVCATFESEVERALSALQLYDTQTHTFTCWKRAAKAFDDWRLVLIGPAVNHWWEHHKIPQSQESLRAEVHAASLCFFCHNSSRWGPCEHMYAGLEHEGHINSGSLPQTKPPGRPPKMNMPKRRALPPSVGPGPGIEQTGPAVPLAKAPKQSSDSSPEELALQNFAGCSPWALFPLFPAARRFHWRAGRAYNLPTCVLLLDLR